MNKNTPRDFFLYLFATGALYFIAVTIIALLWQYVNYFFPDPAFYQGGISSGMRFAIATLIVVFPIYIGVMRFLSKDIDRNPEKKNLAIRKWLTYVTLFVAAVTIIVDLVSLVFSFLGGELALQFTLKALSVLIVAGSVFWYYLYNLKREPGTDVEKRKLIMWLTIILVTALVIGAFFVVGSPETNRLRRLDQQRVSDLQSIQWRVLDYWQTREQMPKGLEALEDDFSGFSVPTDPGTGHQPYEYLLGEGLSFQLCANFDSASLEGEQGKAIEPFFGLRGEGNWTHEAGRFCFERIIDPAQYPPLKR
ncbi:MAG: DUF5671 domain-containing protein [Candidatus Harrisonbacteria bacterium]|nr:DUF5671 domain-containing protein [Candidatus Harrisonbacteria bacterium]